jgi:two-component system sensor histidine kinase BarA
MSGFAVPFRKSIRFRLSLVIAIVIFAAVMTTAAVGAFRDLDQAADARAQSLEAAASAYSAALAEPLANRDRPEAFEHMKGMQHVGSVIFMALLDADGQAFAQLGAGASIRGRTADLRELSGFDLLNSDRGSVTLPVVKAGEQIGELVVLADITDLRVDLYGTLAWTALVALFAIAGGVAIAQVSISHMIRPIGNLAAAMSEVGARQDFTRRMPPSKRKDETAILGDAFNGMIDNIQERDAKIARHMETLEQTVEDRTRDYRLAKEEAESANAAKSDFLATMSHEIRTPMNGMMVMAEMLASADLSTRHRRYAEIITRSGASLLTIINDILDLSKIEAGKLDLETVPFSPERMVEDVASLFWEKARSKGLELAIRVAPETPEQVLGDPTRLNQVITNLVNNALKFTDKGGVSVDLSAKRHRGPRVAPHRRHRHRRWYRAASHRRDLRGVQPGRSVHHTALWRHRPWPHGVQAPRGCDGRRDHRHVGDRQGLDLCGGRGPHRRTGCAGASGCGWAASCHRCRATAAGRIDRRCCARPWR